ncbi:unnamed protein product [Pieris brassicae]|uniref:Uncharacterized protein n=1 Tax=Pieris brassicae TaxID=7116 RepID=A0A9P0T1K6_PIEBR|nr:unnamed protein product [Pieris brassicae]
MFRNILVISLFVYAFGQDFYEERHKYQYRAQIPLNKIPKSFEVKGDNAVAEFSKYLATIQDIAKRDNLTVIYKVKVDINSPKKQHNNKKSLKKKSSKKYNVPLKKQNMKLSNFEMILRKRIGEMGQQQQRAESDPTTQKQKILLTTKSPSAGKYKPIIRSVRTNYTKIVRPVRNKVITLT